MRLGPGTALVAAVGVLGPLAWRTTPRHGHPWPDADVLAAAEVARAARDGDPIPDVRLPPGPVVACAWSQGVPTCARATGATLAEVARGLPQGDVTVDVLVDEGRAHPGLVVDDDDPGAVGYHLRDADHDAIVLPVQVWRAARDGVVDVGAAAGGAWSPRTRVSPVRTTSATAGAIVAQGRRRDRPPVDAALARTRAVWAAEYLLGAFTADGRLRYRYDVPSDQALDGDNPLRACGAAMAMLQAYARTGFGAYLVVADAVIHRQVAAARREERHGVDVMFVVDDDDVKLGGAALLLLALVERATATGDADTWRDERAALGRFLLAQQEPSGELRSYAPLVAGDAVEDRDSRYYPGEAVLALVRLDDVDPDPALLDAAVRGARWLRDVRDAGLGPDRLDADHWLLIATSWLAARTGDARFADDADAIGGAVVWQHDHLADDVARHPAWSGAYGVPPRSTPAATRAEALVAWLDTCAVFGRDCAAARALLVDTVGFVASNQLEPSLLFWVPDPGDAVGGVLGGPYDLQIRVDYVQHALSALLGTERVLSDGGALPGGPWRRPPATMERAELDALRAPIDSVRGRIVIER